MDSFMKPSSSFDANKVKANLRMAITRINIQKNKLVNSIKVQRRGIAELLAIDKYDSARINVEACIRDDLSIEGMEVLSLFLNLLSHRVQLIAECKTGKSGDSKSSHPLAFPLELKEAISSVVWASARLADRVPELNAVRKAFESKFGKGLIEISVNNTEFSVNPKLMERLGTVMPSNESCITYLSNIAKEFALENFDEERLRDPKALVAAAAVVSSVDHVADLRCEENKSLLGGFMTASGGYVPPLKEPYDALDRRVLRLKRS
ncbi:unnamed protein product [Phytomonas sp. EM1]|nr:unnamed protein product [Phytomonas sp. EM1]|eukprot:CCW60481.1 unnamed protein product [Phytomonas sp. isolate EM1]